MGDLEAKLATCKAEIEQRALARRKLEYDLSVTRAELDKHKSAAAEWEQLLSAAGVPAARILTVAQAVESPQLAHRGFLTEVPFPGDDTRSLRLMGNGVLLDGEPLPPSGSPPRLAPVARPSG